MGRLLTAALCLILIPASYYIIGAFLHYRKK